MLRRLFWFWTTSRLGPDMLSTHFLLFFKKTGHWLCRKKFKHFGENSEFRPYAYAICTFNISIGSNVIIRPGSMLFADNEKNGYIIIEDDVGIGSGVHIYVHNHAFCNTNVPIKYQGCYPSHPVTIRRGAWIGANAILLPGATVGNNAVVGAGSVVTKDVPDYTVAVGNPAKVIKSLRK